jgi:nucleotide-binding universal stress UspA family protein
VLVPLDGSDKDQRVVPAAAAFADLADGDIHVIRVLDIARESLTRAMSSTRMTWMSPWASSALCSAACTSAL